MHFNSKYEVEKHIAKVGVRSTILAQLGVADIGGVAVRVLEDGARFTGKRFDLASDELAGNDAMAILSRVTGRWFT